MKPERDENKLLRLYSPVQTFQEIVEEEISARQKFGDSGNIPFIKEAEELGTSILEELETQITFLALSKK